MTQSELLRTVPVHRVLRLWVRPKQDEPLVEMHELSLVEDKGVRGDHGFDGMRHVTVIFEDDWAAAERELARRVDPSARRANVLVSGGGGASYVGKRVRLGGAVLDVKGVVAPCPVMERGAPGLENALKPDGRSGVWARIVDGATVHPGDVLGTG